MDLLLRRSLHWERGLKPLQINAKFDATVSLPSLGAWIETMNMTLNKFLQEVAPFIGSVD